MNLIRAIAFDLQRDSIEKDIPSGNWEKLLHNDQFTLWVDLCGDQLEEFDRILRETFHFHPLAIKDALVDSHVPRIDDWQTYLYLTLRCASIEKKDSSTIHAPELDVFIGENFMVTYHKEPLVEIESLFKQCTLDKRILEKGAAHLFYMLAEEMVNNYMPVIEKIGEMIDQIEDDIFNHPKTAILSDIFSLKRNMLHLRGTFFPQREVFNRLARGDFEIIPDEHRIYFRDIYDHMVRLENLNESLRELLSGALDTYLSVVNNRMNEVMKTLTMITTLFMPLAFITGFFGMNFFRPTIDLDNWTGSFSFLLVLSIMILIPLFMFLWMRKKDWM
jgi:magnesium transporter